MPGQVATAFAQGKPGLSLSGSGTFSPIEQGRPRASTIERIMIPKTGLSAPRHAANGQINRALGHGDHAAARINPGHSATRISASLGEVRLNFHKVTHGLAHGAISTPGSTRSAANKDTVWASREAATTTGVSPGNSNDGSSSANSAAGVGAAAASGVTGPIAAVTAAGNGNGNNGNGNGNGNGNNNGANGNGNNGNGHAYGHSK
jgi:hypothetical protein